MPSDKFQVGDIVKVGKDSLSFAGMEAVVLSVDGTGEYLWLNIGMYNGYRLDDERPLSDTPSILASKCTLVKRSPTAVDLDQVVAAAIREAALDHALED